MNMKFVNLYENGPLTGEKNGGGRLTCYSMVTSEKVSSCRKKPAILILPGGAYRWTSPREAEPVALRFLAKGWAAFVLDYGGAPAAFPGALREAAAAMRYIR